MLLLKEKELNELIDEDAYVKTPKKRVMPSRASYYANVVERNNAPKEKDEYTIELVRGGRAMNSSAAVSEDLDVNDSKLTETDLRQYEKLSSDLVPSTTTMRSLSSHRVAEDIESAEEAIDFKVNKKGLLMLMIYAIIIIAIFTFIIVNAVSLVKLMNTTSSLENRIAQIDSDRADLEDKINKASDPNDLYNRLEGEWVPAEPSGTITLTVAPPEPDSSLESSTNIYDWILDNLFGGGL